MNGTMKVKKSKQPDYELDREEQEIESALERGDFVQSKDFAKTKKMFQDAAQGPYLVL